MKKILKKQIKEDEFVSGVEMVWGWVEKHPSETRLGTVLVVAIAIIVGGTVHLQAERHQAAQSALASALQTFEAPVAAELRPGSPKPEGPVFETAEEKYRKSAAAFDGVLRAYPSLSEGQRARFYGAVSRLKMGDRKGAEQELAEITKDKVGGPVEASLARLALADADRLSGALDKAIESYRDIADDRSFAVPRAYALMALGSTLEEANRLEEALVAYQRVSDEFPESVYAAAARRRADYLKPLARS